MIRAGIFLTALLLLTAPAMALVESWRLQVGLVKLDPDVDEPPPFDLRDFGATSLGLDDDSSMQVEVLLDTGGIFSIDLFGSSAFQHELLAQDGEAPEVIATIRQYTAMLSARWYPFGDLDVRFQPFLQVGGYYMYFFDETVSREFKRFLIDNGLIEPDDSLTIRFHNEANIFGGVGLDIYFTDRFYLAGGASYLNARTKFRIKVSGVNVDTIRVDYDPWVTWISLGYRF